MTQRTQLHLRLIASLVASLAPACVAAIDDGPVVSEEEAATLATLSGPVTDSAGTPDAALENPVADVTLWMSDGLDPEFDATGSRVLFMRTGADGYTDIWEAGHDGGNATCRTCDWPISASGHVGNPRPTPDNRWVFFTVERASYLHKSASGRCQDLAHPGVGLMNEIYVARRDFSQYELVRPLSDDPAAEACDDQTFLYAVHVSPDGSKIGWSETVVSVHDQGEFGEYRIWIADLVEDRSPSLENIVAHNPGNESGWREFGGFLPGTNNRVIVGSGDINVGQSPKFGDVFRYNLVTGVTTNLSPVPLYSWDETIHPNSDGSLLAWHSSRYLPGTVGCLMFGLGCVHHARTEYWIMRPFGLDKQRLTYFNEPGYPEYVGLNAIGTNINWDPGHLDRGLVSMMLANGEQRIYHFVLRDALD